MTNSRQEIPPGRVSELPTHHGDGCHYGGDVLVTFGGTTINLGPDERKLAHLIASAPELYEALQEACIWDSHDEESDPSVWLKQAQAALDKARGKNAG